MERNLRLIEHGPERLLERPRERPLPSLKALAAGGQVCNQSLDEAKGMQCWPLILGAVVFYALMSHSDSDPIVGLDSMDFPVVLREDDGCFHLIVSSDQFLSKFELQDLVDETFWGWDSRGRFFRFIGYQHNTRARAEIGNRDLERLNESLTGFLCRASELPGWSPVEEQEKLRAWLDMVSRKAK
jgi:hypothetical protein